MSKIPSRISYYCGDLPHLPPGVCVRRGPSYPQERGKEPITKEQYDAWVEACAAAADENDWDEYRRLKGKREAHTPIPGGRQQLRYPDANQLPATAKYKPLPSDYQLPRTDADPTVYPTRTIYTRKTQPEKLVNRWTNEDNVVQLRNAAKEIEDTINEYLDRNNLTVLLLNRATWPQFYATIIAPFEQAKPTKVDSNVVQFLANLFQGPRTERIFRSVNTFVLSPGLYSLAFAVFLSQLIEGKQLLLHKTEFDCRMGYYDKPKTQQEKRYLKEIEIKQNDTVTRIPMDRVFMSICAAFTQKIEDIGRIRSSSTVPLTLTERRAQKEKTENQLRRAIQLAASTTVLDLLTQNIKSNESEANKPDVTFVFRDNAGVDSLNTYRHVVPWEKLQHFIVNAKPTTLAQADYKELQHLNIAQLAAVLSGAVALKRPRPRRLRRGRRLSAVAPSLPSAKGNPTVPNFAIDLSDPRIQALGVGDYLPLDKNPRYCVYRKKGTGPNVFEVTTCARAATWRTVSTRMRNSLASPAHNNPKEATMARDPLAALLAEFGPSSAHNNPRKQAATSTRSPKQEAHRQRMKAAHAYQNERGCSLKEAWEAVMRRDNLGRFSIKSAAANPLEDEFTEEDAYPAESTEPAWEPDSTYTPMYTGWEDESNPYATAVGPYGADAFVPTNRRNPAKKKSGAKTPVSKPTSEKQAAWRAAFGPTVAAVREYQLARRGSDGEPCSFQVAYAHVAKKMGAPSVATKNPGRDYIQMGIDTLVAKANCGDYGAFREMVRRKSY